jgi:hypothetical protein
VNSPLKTNREDTLDMSAKKTEEKKQAPDAATAPAQDTAASAPQTEKKADTPVADGIIADLDRVHVRTPRY